MGVHYISTPAHRESAFSQVLEVRRMHVCDRNLVDGNEGEFIDHIPNLGRQLEEREVSFFPVQVSMPYSQRLG